MKDTSKQSSVLGKELIDVDRLNLKKLLENSNFSKVNAIAAALKLLRADQLSGALVSFTNGSSSTLRIVHMEQFGITPDHPQCKLIDNEADYCILKSHKVA